MSNEITIIGAGPGGLAAAMLLAHQGRQVRVLERLPRVGGRCSAIEEEGFRFDVGPTFFLYPRVLEEIFAQVGYNLFDEVPMTRLDPQYRINFGTGGYLDATGDADKMESEIARFSPADAGAFAQYMQANRKKLAMFRPILESPFLSRADLLRPSTLKAVPWLKPWHSVGSELEALFKDPRLAIAFSFQAKYLGMSPFQCPSLFTILAFLEYEYGVWHPTGGCSAVSEKMAELATEMGVKICLNEPVEKLILSGRRVTGVQTPKRVYESDGLVINSDFARTMTKLVPDHLRRRWNDHKISRTKFSCSTFMMYLGIEGSYDTKHHTIHIADDYQSNLNDIENRHVLSDDPSFYVQNACVTDPTLAPEGMSALYVLVPVSSQHPNIDWSIEKDRFRNHVLSRLSKIGINDVESRIRFERIVTPDDWDSGFEVHNGATFNMAHNLGQMLHKRPGNRFEDLDGVYLVGGGTHPGSGLPVIYESARITSKLIDKDLGPADRTTPVSPPVAATTAIT
ncbi:MAG: phytoene desaturase family protein [Rubripirellula sp.]